ncbi:MAG: hypothetical protein ACREUC_00185 [Steroidobacteraceae bacterium]
MSTSDAAAHTNAEVPVNTSAEGVHAEPRKIGHRLADFSIALSAIVISLISLSVAIHHGRVQQKLVAANSWPFLRFDTSNDFGEGRQTFSLSIFNSGVGPALLKSLVVRYNGKPVRGWLELLQQCCSVSRDIDINDLRSIGFESGAVPKGVIRAEQSVLLLRLRRLPDNPAIWEQLGAARLQLEFDACYCSIIGECWRSDLRALDPEPTEQCAATPDDYIELGAGFDGRSALPVVTEP